MFNFIEMRSNISRTSLSIQKISDKLPPKQLEELFSLFPIRASDFEVTVL